MNRIGVFFVVTLLLVHPGLAQTSEQTRVSSTTEIVTVPVVVTDSSGKAVRGLKQEDFRVAENGKEQKIASFEEVTEARVSIRGSVEQGGIYTNRLTDENPVALGVMVIDFVNTRTVSQAWAIRGALSFLHKWKGEGGFQQPIMVAAITSRGLRIIHQATTDPAVLEAAMEMLQPQPAVDADKSAMLESPTMPARGPDYRPITQKRGESDNTYDERLQGATREAEIFDQFERSNEAVQQNASDANTTTTMWALMAIANSVAGIPGRKILMWCSEEFPFRTVSGIYESPQWAAKNGTTYEDPNVQALREATLLSFNRANVAIYPVNVAGLLSPDFYNASKAGRPMVDAQWSRGAVRSLETESDNKNYARIVADRTSGFACLASNDIGNCLTRALDDGSHYYMITYHPDPKPKGVGYRKIKVDVKGEKLNVRARENYWYGPVPTNGASPKSEMAVAIGSNLDYLALPIVFKITGFKPGQGGKQIAEFVVGVDGRAMTIDEEHGNHINLMIGAQTRAGEPPTIMTIDTKLKPELVPQIRAKQLTHKGEVELAPGKYELRIVVRDNLSGRVGSVVAPIQVP